MDGPSLVAGGPGGAVLARRDGARREVGGREAGCCFDQQAR